MKRWMIGTALGSMLALAGFSSAQADTWVFRDNLRPAGRDRSMAVKRADFRRCGAARNGRWFLDANAPNMRECMSARGWALDHIIPDPPSADARGGSDHTPSIVNPTDDDWVARQRDMDNTQQMINQQNFFNQQALDNQQMQDQQQIQQQRQHEEIMNEHYNNNQ